MLTILPLSGNHDRKQFACARPALDEWLRNTARQHQQKDISQTFVAVDPAVPGRILGFYAMSACELVTAELPERLAAKLPRRVPAVRLGRLAVDRSVQGQGLGELLLMDAIRRTCEVRERIGVFALFVDAKDEGAESFYGKYGFIPLPDASRTMVLPLAAVCTDLHAASSRILTR
jgi:GNAT superfamily N-acetyltransferase